MSTALAPRRRLAVAALLIALAAIAAIWALSARGAASRSPQHTTGPVMLFSSLPLIWGESAALGDMLGDKEAPHWFRAGLEARGKLLPLDSLEDTALAGSNTMIMAQPRALAPGENVAIDDWVRGGGRLLLFADPALTWHSAFAIGDKRRPLDTVLLSPILDRWGLELRYDEDQPAGQRLIGLGGGEEMFVNQAGQLIARPGGQADCRIVAEVLAECSVGKGRVVIAADAALLEPAEDAEEAKLRQTLLDELLARLS